MTGDEIKAAASAYVREISGDIDLTDALTAINEAIARVSDLGLSYATTSIIAAADVWNSMPSGCIYVVEVYDSSGDIYEDWRQRKIAELRFDDADTYTVLYRGQPAALEALTGTPSLHVAYHNALVTYLKGWSKLQDDDENVDGQRLMAQFDRDVQRTYMMLRRHRKPSRVLVERAARSYS